MTFDKIFFSNSERLKLDLSITNVQESDFGVYTCMMDNAVIGGSVEVNFTLTKIGRSILIISDLDIKYWPLDTYM